MKKLALMLLPAMAIAIPAFAHHSPASYDTTKRVKIQGTVKAASFRNPHGHITVEVRDARGKVSTWQVETSAANLLRRRGWVFGKVKTGVTGTFFGHPNKTVPQDIYLREIEFTDGTRFGDKGGNDNVLD